MTAASDALRLDALCSRVDEFLQRFSHIMLLTDIDIPDEDALTRCHNEALTIKAELMSQRSLECAQRLLLIDNVINKTVADCPHLEWAANYLRRTNPDLEGGMLMHGVILSSSNLANRSSRTGKRNYQSETRPDKSRKLLLQRMERNARELVQVSYNTDRKYADSHPKTYRRQIETVTPVPQQVLSEGQEAITSNLKILIAEKMNELLPLVKDLSKLVPFTVNPHMTTSFTLLSANMRHQTVSIAQNTHANPHLETLFHAMYPQTTEYIKVGRRSTHSGTNSSHNLESNTQEVEDGYKAIATTVQSQGTINDPRLLLFEDDDEDYNDSVSNDSKGSNNESDSSTGADDEDDLYACSGDDELTNENK